MNRQKIVLINGSPRRSGTSFSFSRSFKMLAEKEGHEAEIIQLYPAFSDQAAFDALKDSLAACDAAALIAPLYADALPYPDLWVLEKLSDECGDVLRGKRFFAVGQCGFPDVTRLEPLIDACRFFAEETGMVWLGGLAYGGGAIINGAKMEDLGKKGEKITAAFGTALEAVLAGEQIPDHVQQQLTVRVPLIMRHLLTLYLNHMVRKMAKEHDHADYRHQAYLEN